MAAVDPTRRRSPRASASTRRGARSPPRTAAAAGGLRADFGLSPGDRVAIVMRNRPEYLEALFAVWHAGLVAVPVNARLHRDEFAYILDDSGTAVVVTDAEHADDVDARPVERCGRQWSPRRAWNGSRSAPAPLVDRGRTIRRGCSTRAARPDGPRARRSRTATSADGIAQLLRRHRPGVAAGQHPPRRAAVARLGALRPAPHRPRASASSRSRAASTATRSPPSCGAGRGCRSSPHPRW